MTFFYDLNKKLDSIREKPEVTHGQLNERDMSRAAKGYEKYGKQGMQALAKAGREGKALDPVRNKYDKYDNKEVDEGLGDVVKKVGGAVLNKLGHGSDKDMRKDLQRKMGMPQTGDKPDGALKYAAKTFVKHAKDPLGLKNEAGLPMTTVNGKKVPKFAADGQGANDLAKKKTFADKIAGAKQEVEEMLGDVAAEAIKSALSPKQKKIDMNKNGRLDANDFAMLRGGKTSNGGTVTKTKTGMKHSAGPGRYGGSDEESHVVDRLKGPSTKNLTGKEETDEGFDDMEKDVKNRMSARRVGDVTHGAKHDTQEIPGGRRVTRRTDPNTGYSVGVDDDKSADGEKRGRGRPKGTKGAIGAKGPSGRSKLMNKEASHDENPNIAKAKAILKRAGYTVTIDGEEELDEKAVSKKQQRFMGMVHATQKGEKASSKEVAKVAKSMGKKDAEDFASTKHKGLPEKKKPEAKKDDAPKKKEKTEEQGGTGTPTASSGFSYGKGIYDSLNRELEGMISEGMNINMSMNSDANGGPSRSLTVTATDDDAMKLGELLKNAGLGGHDYSMGNTGPAEVEIHGAEDIADQIRQAEHSHDGAAFGGEEVCDTCGQAPCDCEEVDEAAVSVSNNQPDYPTDQETAQDNFEYSGGLNGPKSTGQTTIPVIAGQDERMGADDLRRLREMAGLSATVVEEVEEINESHCSKCDCDPCECDESVEESIARLREMSGIREAKKVEEDDMEEGNLFTGNLAKARADGKKEADLDGDGKMEKVDESILAATANLWKTYKGQYGV